MAAVLLIMNNEPVIPMSSCLYHTEWYFEGCRFYYSWEYSLSYVSSHLCLRLGAVLLRRFNFRQHEIGPLSTRIWTGVTPHVTNSSPIESRELLKGEPSDPSKPRGHLLGYWSLCNILYSTPQKETSISPFMVKHTWTGQGLWEDIITTLHQLEQLAMWCSWLLELLRHLYCIQR